MLQNAFNNSPGNLFSGPEPQFKKSEEKLWSKRGGMRQSAMDNCPGASVDSPTKEELGNVPIGRQTYRPLSPLGPLQARWSLLGARLGQGTATVAAPNTTYAR